MDITHGDLVHLLGKAFDSGATFSAELRDQCIDEILTEKYGEKEEEKNEVRVFKVKELRKFPVGTKFYHPRRGYGVVIDKNNESGMRFNNGAESFFSCDASPWNEPMTLLRD